MGGDGAHGVVGNAGWGGPADPCRIGQEGIKSSITTLHKTGRVQYRGWELIMIREG